MAWEAEATAMVEKAAVAWEAKATVAQEVAGKAAVAWEAEEMGVMVAGKAAVAWEAEATEMGVKVAVALEAEVGAGSSSTPRATACWRLSYQHGCLWRSRCRSRARRSSRYWARPRATG